MIAEQTLSDENRYTRNHISSRGAEPEVISIVNTGLQKTVCSGSKTLIEISLPQAQTGRGSAASITAVESAEAVSNEMIDGSEHLFDQKVLARLKSRDDISDADYKSAREHAIAIRAELMDAFDTVDVIVTPHVSRCPPSLLANSREK